MSARYSLTVKSHFDAAHFLYDYPGACCELHGHTWDVEVTVEGTELDELGIVYDFKALKSDLATVLETYDHRNLNDIEPFSTVSPTAENLARIIYEALVQVVDSRVQVAEVAVWESPIARVAYRVA
ncbi:MAG: 6-carboxytetrahydropterin synthase QueD [Coriobacteriia bacterium]|nr:6-carboxytetrahydropterin synthase QueD [Coriobacteriia bacterium]